MTCAQKFIKGRVLLRGLALFVVVGTLLPLVREPLWWIRFFDFPRLQLALLGMVVLGLQLIDLVRCRKRGAARADKLLVASLGLALLYQAWLIWPYTPLHPVESVDATDVEEDRSFRLVISNVLMTNRETEVLLDSILAAEPDLVVLLEPDAWWLQQVRPRLSELAHAAEHPRDNFYGIALYSRFPLRDLEVRELVDEGVPSLWGAFELPGGELVRFAFIHPTPPHVGKSTADRDAELVLTAREVDAYEGPVVVAGDFNDVAWSYTTKLFQELSGLLDPRVGRGLYPTYHADYFALRWPLDHAFHSEHLALGEFERLEPGASDHFPILVEFAINPEAASTQDAPDAEPEDREQAAEILEKERQ